MLRCAEKPQELRHLILAVDDPCGFVGAGIYGIKNDDTDYDESKLGFSGGLGFALGLSPMLDIDIAGRLVVAAQEDGSKKAFFFTAGLNYYFNLGQ